MRQASSSILASFVFLTSCASAPVVHVDPTEPPAGAARLSQAESPEEAIVLAEGEAFVQAEAVADAQKAAVLVVVDKVLLKDKEEREAFDQIAGEYFSTAKSFLSRTRIVGQRQDEEGKYQVSIETRVQIERLRSSLEKRGVLRSLADTADEVDNPSICVMPDRAAAPSQVMTSAVSVAKEFFTSQGYRVDNVDQIKAVDSVSSVIGRVNDSDDDDAARIFAQEIGCDLYASVKLSIGAGQVGRDRVIQATSSVEIFDTTTGEIKGTATGRTGERVASDSAVVVGDAVRDAVRGAQVQLLRAWRSDSAQGTRYRLEIHGDLTADKRDRIIDAIAAVVNKKRVLIETDQTLSLQIWSRHREAREVARGLRAEIAGAAVGELIVETTGRKFIRMRLE
jgi:hypothetical protein